MDSSWCESLRNWLADQFPKQHACETGPIVVKQERLPEGNPVDNHLMLVQSAYARSRVVVEAAGAVRS